MKIAVVIPFHNAGEWLGRCLDSIPDELEVFLVNDHSVDNSEMVIVDKCSERMHKNWNMTNVVTKISGVAHARNVGITEALVNYKPDYITFLDADDTMNPDAYDQLMGAIKEAPDEPIIQLNHKKHYPNGLETVKDFNKRGIYRLEFLPRSWVVVWNKIYKAELLKSIYFKDGLQRGEDELFNLECLVRARRIYCSERIHMTHRFDNDASLSKRATPEDVIDEQRALIDFLEMNRNDKEICRALINRQKELWFNPPYHHIIG